ncbi:MAG: four-carbon acid sugar kinase family protein [Treponema sp.]|jgi:uncharacterized protein YgbK (DUF1537 family)|nr:four-carbon acid sugar kinase family protein [Treponema sp.]
MHTLLILADDLTGALDTAVQAAEKGIPVRVYRSPESARALPPAGTGVLAINTATRHLGPEDSRAVVDMCLDRWKDIPFVYKKTDSALRGNIGAELEALLRRRGGPLPFIPAWPDMGRTTEGGHQYINGIPLEESDMARDALNPLRHGFIPEIIAEQSTLPVSLVPAPLPEPPRIGPGTWSGDHVVIFDARTGEDLHAAAAFLMERKLLGASAGCAGFAEALMAALPFHGTKTAGRPERFPKRPLLIVSGSRHAASVAQIRAAMAKGVPGVMAGGKDRAGLREDIRRCAGFIREQGVSIAGTRLSMTEAGSRNGEDGTAAEHAATSLAAFVRGVMEETGPLHLAVFGGDTLLRVMEALAYEYLVPQESLQRGVAVSVAVGRSGRAHIVTKAGAFGERDLIQNIRGYVASREA